MKPVQDIVTRDGLTELLREKGFSDYLSSPTNSMRKYDKDGKTYAICFLFPTSSEDPTRNAGFAGMGTAKSGKPVGNNFVINYGRTTYRELYREIQTKIEPHIGKIL